MIWVYVLLAAMLIDQFLTHAWIRFYYEVGLRLGFYELPMKPDLFAEFEGMFRSVGLLIVLKRFDSRVIGFRDAFGAMQPLMHGSIAYDPDQACARIKMFLNLGPLVLVPFFYIMILTHFPHEIRILSLVAVTGCFIALFAYLRWNFVRLCREARKLVEPAQ